MNASSLLLDQTFSPPAFEGASWIASWRKKAWQDYLSSDWSSLNIEDWRFIKPERFTEGYREGLEAVDGLTGFEDSDADLILQPGWTVGNLPDGLRIESLTDSNQKNVEALLALASERGEDRWRRLHAALFDSAALMTVDEGAKITRPISVLCPVGEGTRRPLLLVHLKPGSSLTLLEEPRSAENSNNGLLHSRTLIHLAEGASLNFIARQSLDESQRALQHHDIFLGQDARFEATYLSTGSKLQRVDQQVHYLAPGASGHVTGLMFAHGRQTLDFHTKQLHHVPHTSSQLFFRNVLTDRARTVFNGYVYIDKNAPFTEADQRNKNLLLSNEAEAVTVPRLDIDCGDVKCAHGATVSTLDDEEVFYLMTRGLTERAAKRMIVGGFFEDALVRVPESMREGMAKVLHRRLEEVLG